MYNNQQKVFSFLAHQFLLPVILAASWATSYAATPASGSATPAQAVGTRVAAAQATPGPVAPSATPAASGAVSTNTAAPATADPYEWFNRPMFTFNDTLDTYIMKPIAKGYNYILPKPINEGIHNFFLNVNELPIIANDILQFNFYQMANDMWRFGINTTIGVLGFIDVASRMGLNYYSNDFGLTMASWGWENSNYLVIPFFGPSTLRDGIGIPVDYFEFSIYPHIYPMYDRYAIYGVGVVDRRAQLLKFQPVLEEISLDKYVFMRSAYMQRRAYQVNENQHLGYKGSTSCSTGTTS